MRRRPFAPLWLAAALALLPACSLVNDPGDHQALAPVPVEEVCAEFAEVVCDAHLGCCSTATVAVDDCLSRWAMLCANQVGSLAIDPRTGYDPRAAAEVIAEGRAFAAACDTDVMAWFEARSGFQRVLSGTVAGGGDCTPSNALDLAAYFSCDDLGQACLSAGAGQSVCADRRPVGSPCNGNFDCAEGLWCNGGGILVPGVCAERRAEGQPCTENLACESLVCDGDLDECVTPSVDAVFCALEPPG